MSSIARKTFTAALAAVTLGATVLASAEPASARGGFRGHGGFHGGVVRHHGGWGRGAAIGLGVGALALGALAAPTFYGECYLARRAIVNRFGEVVGYRRVRVCD